LFRHDPFVHHCAHPVPRSPYTVMNSVVLSTHTAALFAEAVERAADLLRAGQLVALPTETVYGLAANAWDAAAVARIYEVKGRPARNPIIFHVAGLELARVVRPAKF